MPVVTALPAKAVKMIWWSVCVLALWVPGGVTFSMYKEEIPNGDHVPHPCKANFIWHGVGHQNALGGGAKNPFGEDFSAHGKKWNADLCNKDSDGDGRTNGQELGDPDCVWTKGELPRQTEGITHPGVCEPMDSAECMRRNAWVDCSNEVEFVCPHINDPDVRNVTIRFPRTKVPAKETTYICFNFELPDDREYHLIANKPFIDNQNVMHHIILNGCDNHVGLMDSPQECLMGTPGCTAPLAGWTVGQAGVCWNVDAGYPFGNGRSRIVSMQLHWTNPGLVDEWFDSSGLTLYYTPKLRTYNAGLMNLGQTYLNIPPGQTSWVHQGTCTRDCTRRYMTGDIQVFAAQSHMHYLGSRQNITLSPSGRPTKVLVDDNPFRYDSPMLHEYDPPLTVQPGDQLQTFCTFQSRSRTETTTYGEGSFEEMCFAFLWYYPAENIEGGSCVQWKDVDFCSLGDKCDYLIFNSSAPSTRWVLEKVLENCDHSGTVCRPECPAAIREVTAVNGCIRNVWDYVVHTVYDLHDPWLMKMVSAIQSCDVMPAGDDKPMTTAAPTKPGETSKPQAEGPGSMLLNLIKHLDARPLLQNIIMNINYNNGIHSDNDDDDDDQPTSWF